MQQQGGQQLSAQQLQQQQQQHAAAAAASRQMQLNGSVYGGQGSPSPRPGNPGMVRMGTGAKYMPLSSAARARYPCKELVRRRAS